MDAKYFNENILPFLQEVQARVCKVQDFPCTCGVTARMRDDDCFRVELYIYPILRNNSRTFVYNSEMTPEDMQTTNRQVLDYINNATGGRIQW